jgi:hypothetical protein
MQYPRARNDRLERASAPTAVGISATRLSVSLSGTPTVLSFSGSGWKNPSELNLDEGIADQAFLP